MKRFMQFVMVAGMLATAGLGLFACSNADYAAMPNNAGIQTPSSGLVGGEEVADVENTEGDGVVDVDIDQDEGDVDVESSDADDPLEISTDALEGGTVGVAYQDALKAHGGSRSYRWSVASGTLPDGLKLCEKDGGNCGATVEGRDASISGTPTASGNFNFAIRIVDDEDPSLIAEKSFSIKIELKTVDVVLPIQSGPTDVTLVPYAAMSVTVAASGKSIPLDNVMRIPPMPMGLLIEPLVLPITVSGGQAPYTWKVVAQGEGAVVQREGGGFDLALTHVYPMLTDRDLDPEIPVTLLVKDANGLKAKTTFSIPVRVPMEKVTDLSIRWCLDEETCETEVNNDLLLFVQDGMTRAAHCRVKNNKVQMEEACWDTAQTTDYPTWSPLNSDLDQIDQIQYQQFIGLESLSLSIRSSYWEAKLLYDGSTFTSVTDIAPLIKDSSDGHLWRRRASTFTFFISLAQEKLAAMASEIANF